MIILTQKQWSDILDANVHSLTAQNRLVEFLGTATNPDENDVPSNTPDDAVCISTDLISDIADEGFELLAADLSNRE